ncbi:FAD/NAD(P)-binding protein [Olleya aquimaris]|uniref:FAD-NAD(P)-binding protein n=1 Tax=Olleya aquimaris TaxID=639310 RepID=A0A327R4Y6_9FLAO|nr:FAD/NAD(P)-binding protein [Olleya aquimaris]RAJ11879.1 FAD-NAD(P)-binding protein [Olleya aquimaris]
MKNNTFTIAVIGCGPRGLSALENLFISLQNTSTNCKINVIIFEKTKHLGSGPIYRNNQPDSNWLNISERALTIEARPKIKINNSTVAAFPSYHQWTKKPKQEILNNRHEVFPKRSFFGDYLRERYQSIAKVLEQENLLKIINQKVIEVRHITDGLEILTINQSTYKAHEVVLTIGHQDTVLSDQLKAWKLHTSINPNCFAFEETYPIKNVLAIDYKHKPHHVGIRGFGLAMMDVTRALVNANGGVFKIINEMTHQMSYTSGPSKLKLIPFSLDGLPMACKPLNSEVDSLFMPSKADLQHLETVLSRVSKDKSYDNGNQFVLDAISNIASKQFIKLNNKAYPHSYSENQLQAIILKYLSEDAFKHNLIVPTTQPAQDIIQSYVHMASATKPISLDYCLGQVWRHCEPILYKTMSHCNLKDEVINEVIAIDERMKRYAFGPPIESLQQLLALAKEGTLDLSFVNDPKIKLVKDGWLLEKNKSTIICDIMVNSVLDSPDIKKVNTPIISNLLKNEIIQPVYGNLGIETLPNGLVVSKNKTQNNNIALLGRLAKGSVVGVDAILECFGPRIKDWSDGVCNRIKQN